MLDGKRLVVLFIAVHVLVWTASSGGQRSLPGKISFGRTLLPNGWVLSPAGRQIPSGDLPMNIAISPDGKYAVVTNNGEGKQSITILDISRERVTQTIPVDRSWLGIRFYDQGRKFALSGGNNDRIYLYDFARGNANLADSIAIGKPWPDEKIWIAGIDIDDSTGILYAASRENNRCYGVDIASKQILFNTQLPDKGYTCLVSRTAPVVYVSVWAGSAVAVLDKKTGTIEKTIAVGDHPNDMAETPDGRRLFVANGNENTVSVVDLAQAKVTETISTALEARPLEGSTPNSVALSGDGTRLFIANADNNFLAVMDVSKPGDSRSVGFIPTGWYPTCVRIVPKSWMILVTNGKGKSSMANPKGPQPYHKNPHAQYIGSLFVGTISLIGNPSPKQLDRYSQTVRRNTPPMTNPDTLSPGYRVIATDGRSQSPIKHVFYFIKENRTYDQVFGDIKEGNGDPRLCLFDKKVTPNLHALAKQFVLLDNFYCDAEVSADGHQWSMGAYASDYTEKSWPTTYGGRGGEYEFEGGYPAAYPSQGYIWDNCNRHGVSYRTYGEYAENGTNPGDSAVATMPSLRGHVAPFYRTWDLDFSDLDRVKQWEKEFDEYERNGGLPQFIIIKLPNDHTYGSRKGALTPKAYVAQNDYAVGLVVERISHSVYWKESAIFSVEDDAQNGPDHVDAHRTEALVISPYTKRGFVDKHMYSTSSMVKTMEMILGLPPLSQFDAATSSMANSFTAEPDFTPFVAVSPIIDLGEKNIAGAYGQDRSNGMNFTREDLAPDALLNEIIWKSVRGVASAMPSPVRSAFIRPLPHSGARDDD